MNTVINLVLFIIILGVIVAIHELGHLIFAKKAKILCFEYAIGMGPVIYRKKNKETSFSLRAIPIGGFVSMAGEQMSTSMIKEGQTIGINLKDGVIEAIILDLKLSAEQIMRVENFEIYDEQETGDLFIEGYINDELVKYPISKDAYYHVSAKEQMKIAPYNRSFESKTFMQKLLTLIAGPGMNFILSLFLLFLIASIAGKPLKNNIISTVTDNTPASLANFEKGDEIIKINDFDVTDSETMKAAIFTNLKSYENVDITVKKADGSIVTKSLNLLVDISQLGIANFTEEGNEVLTSDSGVIVGRALGNAKGTKKKPGLEVNDIITAIAIQTNLDKKKKEEIKYGNVVLVNSWYELIKIVENANLNGESIKLTVQRKVDDELRTIDVEIISWEKKVLKSQGVNAYNIQMGISTESKYNFVYSLYQPFIMFGQTFKQIIIVVGMLFGGSKQVGVGELSGPIGIFSIIEQVRRGGFLAILSFTAFLSINIGILNLLPIPVLDGGRVVFITIEAITRKKIPRKVENIIINIFFILMMALFVFVTFNDVWRLIFK